MTKFLRCKTHGCRTLTSNGLCDQHRAPEPAASAWSAITPEQWERSRIEAETQFAEMMRPVRQRAAMREDLAALADGATKAMRRFERPTFSGEC